MVSQTSDQNGGPEPATHRDTFAAVFDFAEALWGDSRYPEQFGTDLGSALYVLLCEHERIHAPDDRPLSSAELREIAHLCPHGGGHWIVHCDATCKPGEKGGS